MATDTIDFDALNKLYQAAPTAEPPAPTQEITPPPAKRANDYFVNGGEGMREQGNIDLTQQPQIKNADGSISTVRSMSFGTDKGEVLIPTTAADGSRILSPKEAVAQYRKTGKHLGVFDTPENATAFAQQLHESEAKRIAKPTGLDFDALNKAYAVQPAVPASSPASAPVDLQQPIATPKGDGGLFQRFLAARDQLQDTGARNAAEFVDMLINSPASLWSDIQGIASRNNPGESDKGSAVDALAKANELTEARTIHPYREIYKKWREYNGNAPTAGPAAMEQFGGWLSKFIKDRADEMETYTGGKVPSEDMQLVTKTLMDMFGTKGAAHAVQAPFVQLPRAQGVPVPPQYNYGSQPGQPMGVGAPASPGVPPPTGPRPRLPAPEEMSAPADSAGRIKTAEEVLAPIRDQQVAARESQAAQLQAFREQLTRNSAPIVSTDAARRAWREDVLQNGAEIWALPKDGGLPVKINAMREMGNFDPTELRLATSTFSAPPMDRPVAPPVVPTAPAAPVTPTPTPTTALQPFRDMAEARRAWWDDTKQIYAIHEQSGEPHPVQSMQELRSYTSDQLGWAPATPEATAAPTPAPTGAPKPTKAPRVTPAPENLSGFYELDEAKMWLENGNEIWGLNKKGQPYQRITRAEQLDRFPVDRLRMVNGGPELKSRPAPALAEAPPPAPTEAPTPAPTPAPIDAANLTPVRSHQDAGILFAQNRQLYGKGESGDLIPIKEQGDILKYPEQNLYVEKPKPVTLPAKTPTGAPSRAILNAHARLQNYFKSGISAPVYLLNAVGAKPLSLEQAKKLVAQNDKKNAALVFQHGTHTVFKGPQATPTVVPSETSYPVSFPSQLEGLPEGTTFYHVEPTKFKLVPPSKQALDLYHKLESNFYDGVGVDVSELEKMSVKFTDLDEAHDEVEKGELIFVGEPGESKAWPVTNKEDLELAQSGDEYYQLTYPDHTVEGPPLHDVQGYLKKDGQVDTPADIEAKRVELAKQTADKAKQVAQDRIDQMRPAITTKESFAQILLDNLKRGKSWAALGDELSQKLRDAYKAGRLKTPQDVIDEINKHGPKDKQSGKVRWDVMMHLAMLAGGYVIGHDMFVDFDNPVWGGILGMILYGVALKSINATAAFNRARITVNQRKAQGLSGREVDARRILDAYEGKIDSGIRQSWQIGLGIAEHAHPSWRVAIHQAVDQGNAAISNLPAPARALALNYKNNLDTFAQHAARGGANLGVLRTFMRDFLWLKADRNAIDAAYPDHPPAANAPIQQKIAYARDLVSTKLGESMGLNPKTLDAADIIVAYGSAVFRGLAHKELVRDLRNQSYNGMPWLKPENIAEYHLYAPVDHPLFAGMRVLKQLAPSLEHIFSKQDVDGIAAGVLALNTALKRVSVAASLFHAKSLGEGGVAQQPLMVDKFPFIPSPLRIGKAYGRVALNFALSAAPAFGITRYTHPALAQLRHGNPGDFIDFARGVGGLKITLEGMGSTDLDLSQGFNEAMSSFRAMVDKTMGPIGTWPLDKVLKFNHGFDKFMWGRFHTILKLEAFAKTFEELVRNNAAAGHPIAIEDAARIAGQHVNFTFGGINWRRMAENVDNQLGREFLLELFSPKGRRWGQMFFFAEDWLVSTGMAFIKALPFLNEGHGTGKGLAGQPKAFYDSIKGLKTPTMEVDLYRRMMLRAAMMALIIAEAGDLYFTGKHVWETDDWTTIDRGDGRKTQVGKHTWEAVHWMMNFQQQFVNKLGYFIKEPMNILGKTEYLTPPGTYAPPMQGHPIEHAMRHALPISYGQFSPTGQLDEFGIERGLSGMMGFPTIGLSQEEKNARREFEQDRNAIRNINKFNKANNLPPVRRLEDGSTDTRNFVDWPAFSNSAPAGNE